jgi:hypothetical protein
VADTVCMRGNCPRAPAGRTATHAEGLATGLGREMPITTSARTRSVEPEGDRFRSRGFIYVHSGETAHSNTWPQSSFSTVVGQGLSYHQYTKVGGRISSLQAKVGLVRSK